MFHYAPSARVPAPLHTPLANPRDRYLAALAETKAAEVEYLAAEALRREEEALRRRLEAIQLRKLQEEFPRSRVGRDAYTPYSHISELDAYPAYGYDQLSALRRQVEEEQRLRLLARREAEEQQRRRQVEEALLYHLGRQQQAALRLRKEEESRALAIHERSHCHCRKQLSTQRPRENLCANSCTRSTPRYEQQALALHPTLQSLIRPDFQATKPSCRKSSPEGDAIETVLKQLIGSLSESKHTTSQPKPAPELSFKPEGHLVEESFKRLMCVRPETSKPETVSVNQSVPAKISPPQGLQEALNLIFVHGQQTPTSQEEQSINQQFLNLFGIPRSQSSSSSSKADETSRTETEGIQQYYDLFGIPTGKQLGPQASSSSSSSTQENPQVLLSFLLLRDIMLMLLFKVPSPAPANPVKPSPDIESLKEQLESRLNNEFSSEVRDTIQAIFASLQDATESHTSSSSTSTPNKSVKGKGKAASTDETTTSTSTTTRNVVNSLNEVRNIEAAFHALEADFTFPAQLDFLATHVAAGSSPSSDSEASATVHLAYTSRNHPVRFYEQALSALLTQLDSIDSFGSETLRGHRKEVVRHVEKALEELEREVQGRWRTRLSNEAKPAETRAPVAPQPAVLEETQLVPVQSTLSPSLATIIPEGVAVGTAMTNDTDRASPAAIEAHAPTETVDSQDSLRDSPSSASEESPSQSHVSNSAISITDTPSSTSTSNATPDAPTETSPTAELSGSVATVKGYDVEDPADPSPPELEDRDAFLLAPASDVVYAPKHPNNKESEDTGSDWSEVDA
ncbi:hypothetical protein H0H81_000139 [Sphagnurus paluster]|uniref:BAG domain-containing protein n=1 Tax=Sphagnurus paluster TaxID=117069 RepID=A0A9P7GNL0_9AGAR|nr:hypothetical protein H0H81_000139 [Sphagnurus paluster]